jgi:hypothetical protein
LALLPNGGSKISGQTFDIKDEIKKMGARFFLENFSSFLPALPPPYLLSLLLPSRLLSFFLPLLLSLSH